MKPETKLTQIDHSVLHMVGEGAKNSEIADRMHYSLPWVKRRLGHLMRHFGARNRTQLAIIANRLTEQPNVNETYRVSHVGGIVPVVAAVHGVQFQVTARDKTVTVKIRINPILAITANLHHNDDGARLLRLAMVRRLRSYLQQGISLDTSLHELTIESQEELTQLLDPADCDFKDASFSRCLAASVSDPANGAIDLETCTCNLPSSEMRCRNLSSVVIQAVVALGDTHVGRFVTSARCLAGQPLDAARAGDCVPGRCECWSIDIPLPDDGSTPSRNGTGTRSV